MDTAEEARDYDAMDHAVVNARFCDDLLVEAPLGLRVLDVGTGTALIPITLCGRVADVNVVAIDLADHMLALGEKNIARAGLQDRVRLEKVDAKGMPFPDGSFDATVSNSIVHHIPRPGVTFAEMYRVTAPGGLVFVRDLARPEDDAAVDVLVARHAGTPPTEAAARASWASQRELLRASLKAGLTVDEVEALAHGAGMTAIIRMTSDRHWTLVCRKP